MPTGTDTSPTSDLIERFNAIMADLLACVTDAALRAAGVPWPLRMLLAPLIRRRIARWSDGFGALVADARADRLVASAVDSACEPTAEQPSPDRRCGAGDATEYQRSAVSRCERATAQLDPKDSNPVLAMLDLRATRPYRRRGRPRAGRDAPMCGVVGHERHVPFRGLPNPAAGRHVPPAVFSHSLNGRVLHDHFIA
jgi:hypothetical protein